MISYINLKTFLKALFLRLFFYFDELIFPKDSQVKSIEDLSYEEFKKKTRRALNYPISLFEYRTELMRRVIWEIKYRGNKKIARLVALALYDELMVSEPPGRTYILIPIPISKNRRKKRGFNQCELILDMLVTHQAAFASLVRKDILIKIKDTAPQTTTASKKERMKNLRGCFKVTSPPLVKNSRVILLDDVLTTGSTLLEASKTLLAAGAKSVRILTIAH